MGAWEFTLGGLFLKPKMIVPTNDMSQNQEGEPPSKERKLG